MVKPIDKIKKAASVLIPGYGVYRAAKGVARLPGRRHDVERVGLAGNTPDLGYRENLGKKLTKEAGELNYLNQNKGADLTKVISPEGEGAMVYYQTDSPKDCSFFDDQKELNLPENTTPRPVPATFPVTAAEQADLDAWDAAEEAKILRGEIDPIFSSTPSLKTASDEYTKSLMNFADKASKLQRNADTLYFMLTDIIDNGRTAIVDQQTKEKKHLEDKFDKDPAFKDRVAKVFKVTGTPPDPAAMQAIRDKMVGKLDTEHQTRLAEFDKNSSTIKTNLTNEIARRNSRVDFLRQVARMDKRNAKAILEACGHIREANKNAPKAPVVVGFGMNPEDDDEFTLKGVEMAHLPALFSPTGTEIKKEQNGVLTCKFGRKLFSPWYYGPMPKAIVTDFTLMAAGIREMGHEKILMTMKFKDPDVCLKRAIQAYEGCLRAGFKADDITIKGIDKDGKEITFTKDQLIPPDKAQEIAVVEQNAASQLADRMKPKVIQKVSQNRVKTGVQELKAASTATAAEVAARKKELLDIRAKPP